MIDKQMFLFSYSWKSPHLNDKGEERTGTSQYYFASYATLVCKLEGWTNNGYTYFQTEEQKIVNANAQPLIDRIHFEYVEQGGEPAWMSQKTTHEYLGFSDLIHIKLK